MSDMQLYLIALGAIFIAGVILFNWWQERRLSQDAIRRFDGPADDALMDNSGINRDRPINFDETAIELDEPVATLDQDLMAEPLEPHLADIPEDTLLSELPGAAKNEFAGDAPFPGDASVGMQEDAMPVLASNFDKPSFEDHLVSPASSKSIDLPAGMDDQIDLIALIRFDTPLSGAALIDALHPLPGFDKFTQWLGQDASGAWFALTKDQEQTPFYRVACALQFADRSGPLARECLRKFQLKVETLATNLGAVLEWHGANDPLRYAAELDQFCIDVDVMVGFHLLHGGNGPFAATKLRGIAEAGGMQLREDGLFHYVTESGDTLFSLVDRDQRPFTPELLRTAFIGGISFQMDVPRVRNCPEAFNQMVLLARQMESSLGGTLIDDNQQPLTIEAMDKIRDQLRIIYAKMVARGIIPGSPSALRLFS